MIACCDPAHVATAERMRRALANQRHRQEHQRQELREQQRRAGTRRHADGRVVALRPLPDYDALFGVNCGTDFTPRHQWKQRRSKQRRSKRRRSEQQGREQLMLTATTTISEPNTAAATRDQGSSSSRSDPDELPASPGARRAAGWADLDPRS